MNQRPRHYCGLFGIYGHPNAAELTYYGLYALQHRGQESAGITASDGVDLRTHKGMGLVGQVFDKNILRSGNGVSDEFDMILVNGKDVAIVEVKYKAHATDLDKLLSKKYANFKKLFPAYKNYRHHLVLATFHLYDELKQQALDHNVIVLQRKGNLVESYLPKSEVH